MIRYSILTLFVVFNVSLSFCQSDTLNQVDSNGKKTGWCVAYLDNNLKVLKDSSGATHCMYNYYRRDIWLYRFGEGWGTKKSPIMFPENDTLKLGNYILLNGKYITKYPNGNLRSELMTSNGFMTGFKFYYKNGQLNFEVIISKECGAPLQHCFMEYNKDGSFKRESRSYIPKEK